MVDHVFWTSSSTKETNCTSCSSAAESAGVIGAAVVAETPDGETPRSVKRLRPKIRLSARTTTVPPIPSPRPPSPPPLARRSSRFELRPPGVQRIGLPQVVNLDWRTVRAKNPPLRYQRRVLSPVNYDERVRNGGIEMTAAPALYLRQRLVNG